MARSLPRAAAVAHFRQLATAAALCRRPAVPRSEPDARLRLRTGVESPSPPHQAASTTLRRRASSRPRAALEPPLPPLQQPPAAASAAAASRRPLSGRFPHGFVKPPLLPTVAPSPPTCVNRSPSRPRSPHEPPHAEPPPQIASPPRPRAKSLLLSRHAGLVWLSPPIRCDSSRPRTASSPSRRRRATSRLRPARSPLAELPNSTAAVPFASAAMNRPLLHPMPGLRVAPARSPPPVPPQASLRRCRNAPRWPATAAGPHLAGVAPAASPQAVLASPSRLYLKPYDGLVPSGCFTSAEPPPLPASRRRRQAAAYADSEPPPPPHPTAARAAARLSAAASSRSRRAGFAFAAVSNRRSASAPSHRQPLRAAARPCRLTRRCGPSPRDSAGRGLVSRQVAAVLTTANSPLSRRRPDCLEPAARAASIITKLPRRTVSPLQIGPVLLPSGLASAASSSPWRSPHRLPRRAASLLRLRLAGELAPRRSSSQLWPGVQGRER